MDELLTKLADRPDSEKGDRGRIGIIAGSVDQTGPPALAGKAAMRAGADLVTILTSEEVLDVVAGYSENLTVTRYTGDHLSSDSVSKAFDLGSWADVLVVGPGLYAPDPAAIEQIVSRASVPLVVDADAIEPALDASFSETVVTPDANEVEMIEAAYGSLDEFSDRTGSVVLSTGSVDEIIAGEERWTNDTGTAAMTVAGTGDVLAGTVGSLIGQGLPLEDAARLGSWIVGSAGKRATEEYGIGIVATDLIASIPTVMSV